MDEYEQRKKNFYLDVRSTPCARSALINGIIVGGASGFLYYIKSGIIRRSCDVAVGGFALVSLSVWQVKSEQKEICRYQKAKHRVNLKKTIKILNSPNIRKEE